MPIKSIHWVVCLTTGPKPLPKRALHIVRSRASSFKWEYPLLSLWSSNSLLLYTSGKYLQEWDTNIIIKLYQFLHSPYIIIFFVAQEPPVGQGLFMFQTSWSHSDTPHSEALIWTSDQLVAETTTWQHTTLTRDRHPWSRRDSNP